MTLRVLDTYSDADAIMVGVLMNKLGLAELEVTDDDLRTLQARLNNGRIALVAGGNLNTGTVTLSFVDTENMPAADQEFQ